MTSSLKFRSAPLALLLSSVVLAAAALLQVVDLQGGHRAAGAPKVLTSLLPERLEGWTSEVVPLGPNEFITGEAEKILNFDQLYYRQFSRQGKSFTVYVVYWGPGKMPVQLVASHTPDRCWTENGWRCLEMRFRDKALFRNQGFQPAEWRLFESPAGGSPIHVAFWHLVNGSAYDYGARFNSVPNPVLWVRGAVQQALEGRAEQYFVRLSSTEPIEALLDEPGFRQVLQGLSTLGVAAPASAANP